MSTSCELIESPENGNIKVSLILAITDTPELRPIWTEKLNRWPIALVWD